MIFLQGRKLFRFVEKNKCADHSKRSAQQLLMHQLASVLCEIFKSLSFNTYEVVRMRFGIHTNSGRLFHGFKGMNPTELIFSSRLKFSL